MTLEHFQESRSAVASDPEREERLRRKLVRRGVLPSVKTYAPSQQGEWTPDQPARGLGDVIAKVTHAVGIKTCGGCKKRQEALNAAVPFKSSE